jgi:hypothetical protein
MNCCQSGQFDNCGICDGDDTSCTATADVYFWLTSDFNVYNASDTSNEAFTNVSQPLGEHLANATDAVHQLLDHGGVGNRSISLYDVGSEYIAEKKNVPTEHVLRVRTVAAVMHRVLGCPTSCRPLCRQP